MSKLEAVTTRLEAIHTEKEGLEIGNELLREDNPCRYCRENGCEEKVPTLQSEVN